MHRQKKQAKAGTEKHRQRRLERRRDTERGTDKGGQSEAQTERKRAEQRRAGQAGGIGSGRQIGVAGLPANLATTYGKSILLPAQTTFRYYIGNIKMRNSLVLRPLRELDGLAPKSEGNNRENEK